MMGLHELARLSSRFLRGEYIVMFLQHNSLNYLKNYALSALVIQPSHLELILHVLFRYGVCTHYGISNYYYDDEDELHLWELW